MDGFAGIWSESNAVGRSVAVLLLLMSLCSWMLILWKAWVIQRAVQDIGQGVSAFWAAPDMQTARERIASLDREQVLLPLLHAQLQREAEGTLAGGGAPSAQLTRRLREALSRSLAHLGFGQVLLASIGSTSPFVGLFGTVWGIYHALVDLSLSGAATVEKVSGPVGEALIMTAAGLAVAIPAVLAYNLFGKWIAAAEADLEGFAHDLLELQSASTP